MTSDLGLTDLGLATRDTQLTADVCIKCNICTAACPVAAVTDLFPGPKVVGPQAQRYRAPGAPSVDQAVDYCSGCGGCSRGGGISAICEAGVSGVVQVGSIIDGGTSWRTRSERGRRGDKPRDYGSL